ncbi:MAG: TolC family outer membrane protein [Methylotenera sp.]
MALTQVNQKLKFITVFVGALFVNEANALGLLEAYDNALANDSIFQAALNENEAGQQYKVIGLSSLLPNVSASYSYNKNDMDITYRSVITRTENRGYTSKNAAVQLRQPIINMEGWARYNQGKAQTLLSDKQLEVRKQDLISRFFGLYVTANYSENVLALAEAQRDAFKNQQVANSRLSKLGEGTKTDLIESQAKLGLAEAQVIEAEYNLVDSRNSLATMIGKEVTTLDTLSDSFESLALEPSDYKEWEEITLQNNPEIAAQRETMEIASQEIKRNRAGHMPRLDAVANMTKSTSDSVTTFNQDIDSRSIGLQLNIPFYSGGSVSALTLQAQANFKKAENDLESKTNEVLLNLRKQYSSVLTNILKVDALKQSVASAELQIDATKKSVAGGIRTNMDILNARKQLFEVRRDLALTRYNYLVAYINLRKAAGVLTANDLDKIAVYFKPATASN